MVQKKKKKRNHFPTMEERYPGLVFGKYGPSEEMKKRWHGLLAREDDKQYWLRHGGLHTKHGQDHWWNRKKAYIEGYGKPHKGHYWKPVWGYVFFQLMYANNTTRYMDHEGGEYNEGEWAYQFARIIEPYKMGEDKSCGTVFQGTSLGFIEPESKLLKGWDQRDFF